MFSNAFKFTPESGSINIEIVNTSINNIDYTTVVIKDSGIGIPKNKIDKIFDRFYQVDDSSKRAYGGSGIGLSFVRELVDLHKWKIFVESEVGTGTEFILQIPLNENYLRDHQKVFVDKATVENTESQLIESVDTSELNSEVNQKKKNQSTKNLQY